VHDHGHHGEHEQPTQPAPEPRDSGSHAPHQHPEPPEHAAGQPERHPVDPHQVTRPQLVVVTIISIIALIAPLVWSAYTYNLRIGADDVEDVVMPPGMVNTRDLPAESMSDMAAVDPDAVSYDAPGDAQGAQPLEPRLENGIKVFDLETSVIEWQILPNVRVMAYAFNRQVPGPTLRVTEGDAVRINVTNRLPESTTVHWHGLILPNEMDGPAEITQEPIEPGETFTYEFTTRQAGTFFYHTHDHVDRQQALGLYGALIIDPSDPSIDAELDYQYDVLIELQEWLSREGYTFPAMPMDGALPNYFTINGKAYPATTTIHMSVGERARIRFIGSHNMEIHPMHIHGGPFEIVVIDGEMASPEQRVLRDTVNVGPGQRYDVVWEALEPGKWLLHCHIGHHTTNNNIEQGGGGGLMIIIEVAP
jgi:FtsP/CotA-like multicopper oxidase with cupredoxin domain